MFGGLDGKLNVIAGTVSARIARHGSQAVPISFGGYDLARRAARYRLMCGDHISELPANEFQFVMAERLAVRSKNDPKLAHLLPKYRLWVDEQTGILGLALAERPERDPHAIPSSWFLVLKHAMLYGTANEMLWSYAAQVEGIH